MSEFTVPVRSNHLHVETWGDGDPVILVHGSLATGAEEWEAQRPLADAGFRLIVPDRRGYGASPTAPGEDFLVDAADIVDLMGDGAHLVGHSYGGLGVLFAAVQRPEATLSLTVLEAPVPEMVEPDAAWAETIAGIRAMWEDDAPDDEWVVRFLTFVGSDPTEFPPDFLAVARPLVPVVRRARPFADAAVPRAELAAAHFPKLVVSGGHSAGWEAMCTDFATSIGAHRLVVEGAGHEIQFTGAPLNAALADLWRTGRAG